MNGIILCEGETDQILLSKYFGCQYGFQYEGNCHLNEHNVHIYGCEYKNGSGNFLQIAYVEGKNNFAGALEYILWINRLNAGKFFDYIAVVMDHDSDEEVLAVNRELQNVLAQACLDGEEMNSGWSSYRMKDVSFQDKRDIWDVRFILITLPIEENGALETFLLHSLAEKAENKYLVQQSEHFVEEIILMSDKGISTKKEAKIFPAGLLQSRRLQIKAPLAVYFGVLNPERIFCKFEKVLNSVNWNQYRTVQNGLKAFDVVLNAKNKM